MKTNPNVVLQHRRTSGETISDSSDNDSDPDEDSSSPGSSKGRSRGKVSEPKHKAPKGFRAEAMTSLQNVSTYLESKGSLDKARFDALAAKIDLEHQREARANCEFELRTKQEEKKQHVEMAKLVLGIENTDPEVRRAANEFLISILKS